MKTPRIVVVGSVNADMVVKSQCLPRPGETVTGGQFVMAAGGKGANQAVAAARLGAEVTLVAKVGHDLFGRQAIANYQQEGIVTDYILSDPAQATGVALILVDGQGENLISVASGANYAITPQEVSQAADRIRTADLVMLQLEIPQEVVQYTVGLAAAAAVPVILNPAPAAPLDAGLLRQVTYLTPNESEAERLTGVKVEDEASARVAAQQLCQCGVGHVIVTMGRRGALVADRRQAMMIPGYAVEAIDTTAAGDAFNGGLACALARGASLEEAVREANLVGALSVTRLGAQPSLPTAAELRHFAQSVQAADSH
jgi:ribokinase